MPKFIKSLSTDVYYQNIDKILDAVKQLRLSQRERRCYFTELERLKDLTDETDQNIVDALNCCRHGFRCLESCTTWDEDAHDFVEPTDYSDSCAGGILKLVDVTATACDQSWDYTVGLADYMIEVIAWCALLPSYSGDVIDIVYLNAKQNEDLYSSLFKPEHYRRVINPDTYRQVARTDKSIDEAISTMLFCIHPDTAHPSRAKINNLAVLGDILLCIDHSMLRVLADTIGMEDLEQALVPEYTRTYGLLVPRDSQLRHMKGLSFNDWKEVIRIAGKMKGLEGLQMVGSCSIRDFFLLPGVLCAIALMLYLYQGTCAGFTLLAIVAAVMFREEFGFITEDYLAYGWFDHVLRESSQIGFYMMLNAVPDILNQTAGDAARPLIIGLPILGAVLMALYGIKWYVAVSNPLALIVRALQQHPDLYDLNGAALYYVDKHRLAVAILVESLMLYKKDSSYIRCARLFPNGDNTTYDPITRERNAQLGNPFCGSQLYHTFRAPTVGIPAVRPASVDTMCSVHAEVPVGKVGRQPCM